MLNGVQQYGQLFFTFFSLKLKKGDRKHKKGDPNPQKGPLWDPCSQKGTHFVTVQASVEALKLFGRAQKGEESEEIHFFRTEF